MTRPLNVVLASIGTRGDVQPMLGLAQALLRRGHAPTLAVPVDFEPWVTGLGFRFAPLGVDMQAFLSQNPEVLSGGALKMLRESTRYLKANMLPQARQLVAASAGADVLVYAGIALAIEPSVAEYHRLPALRVNFTTALTPSEDHPPAPFHRRDFPRWLNRLFWRGDRALAKSIMRRTVDAMRADLALPPLQDFWAHMAEAYPAVNAVDEGMFPSTSGWGRRYPYANFLFFDDPAPLAPELEQWLAEGPPPVYVGFGSMSGRGTDRIAQMVTQAVQATGMRCLVGAGWAGMGAGALPAGWRVVRDAPHALLFPRMAAVVHHGGSGTTAQATRAGVPQVVLPLIVDQFHHAHKLYLAGLAPRPVPMEKITAEQLTAAIQAAMALPAGPREAAARRLRASDGCGDVARRIEELVPG